VIEVGVFNLPPFYALGLNSLEPPGEFAFHSLSDPCEWSAQLTRPILIAGARSRSDLDLVTDIKSRNSDALVVVVIDDYDIDTVRCALLAGASGAISRDATEQELVLALQAALADRTLLPVAIANQLALEVLEPAPSNLADDELSWLRSIADSATVAGLGRSAGYSEREMYRRLQRVYRKMGVSNRTEALLKATRLGWIS